MTCWQTYKAIHINIIIKTNQQLGSSSSYTRGSQIPVSPGNVPTISPATHNCLQPWAKISRTITDTLESTLVHSGGKSFGKLNHWQIRLHAIHHALIPMSGTHEMPSQLGNTSSLHLYITLTYRTEGRSDTASTRVTHEQLEQRLVSHHITKESIPRIMVSSSISEDPVVSKLSSTRLTNSSNPSTGKQQIVNNSSLQ